MENANWVHFWGTRAMTTEIRKWQIRVINLSA